MPELPEVETIRKGLNSVIAGKTITGFESRDSKVVRFDPKEIIGMKIESIDRRAKILIIKLTKPNNRRPFGSTQGIGDRAMLCHLKMTGQLIWEAKGEKKKHVLRRKRVAGGHPSESWGEILPCKHTRAIFKFDDGSELFFNDLRRFGYLKLIQNSKHIIENNGDHFVVGLFDDKSIGEIPELAKLGPEIDSSDFNMDYLKSKSKRMPKKKIKTFLMDQEIISGVGNIYSDEALFYAGILPTRLASTLSDLEWEKLIKSTKKAIDLGIQYGGSSEETYVDAFGKQGTMSEYSMVYRKSDQSCKLCGSIIRRAKIGGRSAHFCNNCQK